MAVLIEAISVVIKAEVIEKRYPGGWSAFAASPPNQTLCSDGELTRTGFMNPSDVEAFIDSLGQYDILYQKEGSARDVVVVDQMRGLLLSCPWIEFGHVNLDEDPRQRVAACRLSGGKSDKIVTPEGWTFGRSLSSSYGFVPSEYQTKSSAIVAPRGWPGRVPQ